jgi:hypothetical protein
MTTRAQLIEETQSYLNNREPRFVASMDVFIANAEKRITFALKIPSSRKSMAGLLTIGQPLFTLPADFRSAISFAVVAAGAYNYLKPVQPDFMQAVYPNPSLLGLPKRYAVQDATTIRLGPSPDQAYGYDLEYEGDPPSLVTNPDGTWLSQRCTNALRWAMIVEGYTYMKGEADIMAVYDKRFAEAMAQAQLLVDGRLKNDEFRNGDDRLPKEPASP